jgi:hypothetical protein
MLDSDSLPLQDPAALFEVPAYRRHGSLFWPDLRAGRPELWDLLLETLGADLWEAGPPTWDDPSGERGPSRALGGAGGAGGGGGRAGARRMSLVKLAPHPPPAPPPPPTWLVQRQAESGQILIDRCAARQASRHTGGRAPCARHRCAPPPPRHPRRPRPAPPRRPAGAATGGPWSGLYF